MTDSVRAGSYAAYQTILCAVSASGVLTLTLNRPDKLNSIDPQMVEDLNDVLELAASDDTVRCLLLTGAGRGFCAGRDISSAQPDEDAYDIIANHINPMLARVYHFRKPTIAAVNGAAMGAGLGIALACDIVIAADNAQFSSPFARLGVALDSGGHYFLPRLVGMHRALEMAYTADIIRGKQAAQWGLVNRSVAGTRLLARATELADRIARGPVNAFIGQKALMRRSEYLTYDEICAEEALLQSSLMGSPEYEEGLAAFTEKRNPDFSSIPHESVPGP
ncbi:MAG: 2-(1,2-epoxy,2-dihydrophenyl)acetyl-CoA isomerase [Gaiellaceae bacterium]|jgi:2-(1,2-epoxy-1,2-dihydrophenyl)acetyl-CoA isomerase|nr:2-(1,2-epoxy,2-dihydrophenyl)acetyl-CoA isomerase [Gaiellaceae bacterium]